MIAAERDNSLMIYDNARALKSSALRFIIYF